MNIHLSALMVDVYKKEIKRMLFQVGNIMCLYKDDEREIALYRVIGLYPTMPQNMLDKCWALHGTLKGRDGYMRLQIWNAIVKRAYEKKGGDFCMSTIQEEMQPDNTPPPIRIILGIN